MNINVCQRYFLITKYNIGYHTFSHHVKHHYSHCLLEKDQLLDGEKGLVPMEAQSQKIKLSLENS